MVITLSKNLTYSEKALENLQCFSQQETFALPGTDHSESVWHIKGLFQARNVFFQPSMAEIVDKNIAELSFGHLK
jgi:hypothetical protein